MPILWRYLLFGYLRIFFLSVFTFVSILLVSRFKDIARFAALSSDFGKTALFALYQLPHIFPIALPLSALIASFFLFQKMSRTFELTALRALGKSLFSLLFPVLLTSLFLSLFNFFFCAEISPYCRRESKTLFFKETSENPLLLFQRQNLVKLKDVYMNLRVKEEGKSVKNLVLIALNESHQRLNFLSAKKLDLFEDLLIGKNVAIISHLHSDIESDFDPLIIENQASMSTKAPLLSSVLKKKPPKVEASALNLKMLKIRSNEPGKKGRSSYVEILRRITLSLSVFSFTFLGCVFGMEQGRIKTKKGLITALCFTLAILVSYFLGKELKKYPTIATLSFLFVHPVIWLACSIQLRRIKRGAW